MGKLTKIIKLGATWCGPCKAFGKTFEKVSGNEKFKNIEFKALDIENDAEGVEYAEKFGVRSVPTTILLDENENQLNAVLGNASESSFTSVIENAMNSEEEEKKD